MVVGIHQPNYLPWLGYFFKISQCEKFVFLDSVQFTKGLFINRTKIRTPKGWIWLTIPVKTKGKLYQEIFKVKIDNKTSWSRKHLNSLMLNYKRATFFEKYTNFFKEIYKEKWEKLSELNARIIEYIARELNIKVEFFRASELGIQGKSTELLINICKAVGANTYISGPSGKKYLQEHRFSEEKLTLRYINFLHPTYRQLYTPFLLNMSIVDLLFNEGSESLRILQQSK